MVRATVEKLLFKIACGVICLFLLGCQTTINKIGQEHARDVLKWQELARFAGKELKHSGLTVTAEIQVNERVEDIVYSVTNIRLNRNANHTEVDLLSPEFAEKFACGGVCSNLGLYNKRFDKQETHLRSFFYQEEGRFFEFYGKLSLLNDKLAYYRESSPSLLKKYLTSMLDQKRVFNSLPEFIDYLHMSVTEENLLVFAKSGFKSFELAQIGFFLEDEFTDLSSAVWNSSEDNDISRPDDHWGLAMTADEVLHESLVTEASKSAPKSEAKLKSWRKSKRKRIRVDSIACTYSDNSFGVVKRLKGKKVTLDVMGQAREIVDGLKISPVSGHLFSSAESFYFVKASGNKVYYRDDVASCDIDYLNKVAQIN